MNKLLKKIVACFTAFVMMFFAVGSVNVFADDDTKPTISIENPVEGHTYTAYQLFSGKVDNDATDYVLTDIQWGTGLTNPTGRNALITEVNKLLNTESQLPNDSTAAAVAKVMEGKELVNLAKSLSADGNLVNGINVPEAGAKVNPGYYLIIDEGEDGALNDALNDAMSLNILKVVKNVNVALKVDKPTVTKKIIEGAFADGTPVDSSSASEDETINYRITGTVPAVERFADYDSYKYEFKDTMSAGLTYNDDAKVYYIPADSNNKIEITSSFNPTADDYDGTEDTDVYKGGKVLTASCSNIKAILQAKENENDEDTPLITGGGNIVMEYSCTLNENAKIGVPGNPNKVDLTYTNNPNTLDEGKTSEDAVTVFTFELKIEKEDNDSNPLAGAGFKLYKKIDGTYTLQGDEIKVLSLVENKAVFNFERLGTGDYKLEESTVPAGYNKMSDIEFRIEKSTDDAKIPPTLSSLTVKVKGSDGNYATSDKMSVNLTKDNRTIETTIKNTSSATLPETGGMGTTMLYIAGAVLVLGSVVFFITNRKMRRD